MVIPVLELDTLKNLRLEVQELITVLGIRAEEYSVLRESSEYVMAQNAAQQTYLWLHMAIKQIEPSKVVLQ